mmetsp:Transcript_23942/g.20983  ORF Transcript_23942/g.20983 Transcript_23942/m.20983 type:complete len:155 (+) Transcript_23942:912-1376(+)
MRDVGSLCIDERDTHFFQVRTRVIKDNIISRATEISQAILTKTSDTCDDMIKKITDGYIKMQEALKLDPKDEGELVQLKDDIAQHEARIANFEKEVDQVTEYLDILEDNRFEFNETNAQNYWNLKSFPVDIKTEVVDSQRRAQTKEAKFMERLE